MGEMNLTHEQIDNLQGRELDAAVAEFVMGESLIPPLEYAKAKVGWRYIASSGRPFQLRTGEDLYVPPGASLKQPEGTTGWNDRYALCVAEHLGDTIADEVAAYRLEPKHYSDETDMNATWQVVDAMKKRDCYVTLYYYNDAEPEWIVSFYTRNMQAGRYFLEGDAENTHLALAICRAALHALADAQVSE